MELHSKLERMLSNEAALMASIPEHNSNEMRESASPNLIWREKVTQWCYDVVDHLNESRDVVYVAMNLLDRHCVRCSSQPAEMDEREYELAAMTALFLAVRISGSGNLEVPDLVRMSRGGIHLQEVITTGKAMIKSVSEHRLVTPIQFVRAFLELLPPSVDTTSRSSLLESASFLVEVSVCDAFFIGVVPSKLAMAAVLNASGSTFSSPTSLAREERASFCRRLSEASNIKCDDTEIITLRRRLHGVYSQSDESKRLAPHVVPDDDDSEDDEVTRIVTTLSTAEMVQETINCESPVAAPHMKSVAASDFENASFVESPGKRAVSPERGVLSGSKRYKKCP